MSIVTFRLNLRLKGPILTKASVRVAYGIDAAMYRTPSGELALPATLVKGCLRQAWEEIHSANESLISARHISILLGEAPGTGSYDSLPALLRFEDLVSDAKSEPKNTRYRIAIERTTRSVRHGFLQAVDSPFGAGQPVSFDGTIGFVETAGISTEAVERYLRMGLGFITSVGAERTIGFGRLEDFELVRNMPTVAVPSVVASQDATPAAPLAPGVSPEVQNKVHLQMHFGRPFCIAKHKADNNLFESEEIVPGGVIKGAIASAWLRLLGQHRSTEVKPETDPQRRELAANYGKIRFTHAFPSASATRPSVPPLSLIGAGTLDWRDVLLLSAESVLVKRDVDGKSRLEAPSFQIDWKPPRSANCTQAFNWPNLERRLSVRTEIDRETGRAADEKLYGTETIVPGEAKWLCSIDATDVTSGSGIVLRQLLELLPLLDIRVGKTKAPVSFELSDATAPASRPIAGHYAVMLQTPALLSQPGNQNLRDDYSFYWRHHSNNSLMLKRFFATQELAGGNYLHHRFRADQHQQYQPWLLTSAGSVFLLEIVDAKAAPGVIETWLRNGLQPHPSLGALSWRTCPYLPENGYGEIAVNLAVHQEQKLAEGSYVEV